jgi:hypothetical protein
LLEQAFVIGMDQVYNEPVYTEILRKAQSLDPSYDRPFLIEALLARGHNKSKYYESLHKALEREPNCLFAKYNLLFEQDPKFIPD